MAGRTKEWRAWNAMIRRCIYPSMSDYARYGGRGITVCEQWRNSFATFFEDMGPAPSPKHSLDRIDNDGNYEPSNCRWANSEEQRRNTRRNRFITFDGRTLTVNEWERETGIGHTTIHARLRKGWPPHEVLSVEKWKKRGH